MRYNKPCEFLNDFTIIIPFLIGIIVTISIGWIIDFLITYIKTHSTITEINNEKLLKKAFDIPDNLSLYNQWLGAMERFLFLSAIYIGHAELIGIWLVFKVASKWQAWQNITKVPEKIYEDWENKKEINPIDYLRYRNFIATTTLQRWLIGSIGNILAALIGAMPFILCSNNK